MADSRSDFSLTPIRLWLRRIALFSVLISLGVTLKFDLIHIGTVNMPINLMLGETSATFSSLAPKSDQEVPAEVRAAIDIVFSKIISSLHRLEISSDQAKSICRVQDTWQVDTVPSTGQMYYRYSTVTGRNVLSTETMQPAFRALDDKIRERLNMEMQLLAQTRPELSVPLGMDCSQQEAFSNSRLSRIAAAVDASRWLQSEINLRLSYLIK